MNRIRLQGKFINLGNVLVAQAANTGDAVVSVVSGDSDGRTEVLRAERPGLKVTLWFGYETEDARNKDWQRLRDAMKASKERSEFEAEGEEHWRRFCREVGLE